MIQLRPLSVCDLSFKYAHNLGNGRIKHYAVPYASSLLEAPGSFKPAQKIADYIKAELGEDVEILPSIHEKTNQKGAIEVELVPEVLEGIPHAKKQLEKQKMRHLVHQYVLPFDLNHWRNYIVRPVNFVLNKINRLWAKYYHKVDFYFEDDISVYGLGLFPKLIPVLKYKDKERRISYCQFLSVRFEEEDRLKAIEILRDDIKKLADENLILGHLAMPSQIKLADTIGSGHAQYALFCFLYLDEAKLGDVVGVKNPKVRYEYACLKYPKTASYHTHLNCWFGIQTQTVEGSTGLDLVSSKYQIETIDINQKLREDVLNERIGLYEEQRKEVLFNAQKRCLWGAMLDGKITEKEANELIKKLVKT